MRFDTNNNKKWIIALVAFDDESIEPQVLKEQIDADEDPQFAAFLRGGELMAIVECEDENMVEMERAAMEKRCLR